MTKVSILPADTYIVVNKTVMTDIDKKVLVMLYQPIIGALPINLYLTLWTDLDKTEIMSVEFTHHYLMTNMQLKLENIVHAREKLEAVGLLKTYYKKGNVNSYIYQLYSPLSAAEFFCHPLLSILLYNYLGRKEYERAMSYFKLPKIELNGFEDITMHFDDIFNTKPSTKHELVEEGLRERSINNLAITSDIDFSHLTSSMPKGMLNSRAFDNNTKTLIDNLSFLYKIDTTQMIDIIKGCITEKGSIDKLKLRTACRNYYQFENDDKLPGLIYRNQPDHLRSNKNDDSKRAKIIYTFETLSPYDFLRAKYNGGNPTSRDIKLVESLMIEQALNPGVVNVLLDYVIRINNNKLTKNFVETIAGQWKRQNVETVEQAMMQAEKEYKKQAKSKSGASRKIAKEKMPDWFGKEIKEDKLSENEEAKIKEMLREFS